MFYIYSDNKLIYQPMDDNYLVLQPKLTVEIGKAGSLQFQVPPTHPLYDQLDRLRTYTSVQLDEDEIFRGRILSNERAFNNVRTVYCEGDLAYLVDSVQKGEKYTGTTHALFRKIIAAHNARVEAAKQFTVGEIGIEDRDIILAGQSDEVNTGNIDYKQIAIDSIVDEWNNSFDYIQTCLIDYCGGYLRTRRVDNTTYIDLLTDFGTNASQDIELGVNMLDLKEEISAEDLFTVLIPLGDDNLTIASVNGGSDELVDTAAVAQYGRIVRTHVFQNVNEASTLLENGQRYLASNVNVPTTLTIKAVDMHLLNPDVTSIFLGDKVHLVSTAHNIIDYLTCTKIEYDLANPANTTYTFGNPQQTLTERYREDKRKQSDTYGNGASAGGVSAAGAASSAAGAAAQISDDKTNKALQDFWKEWIDWDPDNPDGKISLGALYKDVKNGKTVLEQQVGIDLDANTGNINIKSFKQEYDETARKTSENEASIQTLASKTESQVTLLASRQNDLSDTESKHYAELKLRADEQGSEISLKADKVTVNADIIDIKGRISNLEADYAQIDSLVSSRIEASWTKVSTLKAGSINADSIMKGDQAVTTDAHFHTLTCSTDGTVRLGPVIYSNALSSFNMADTKFYRDGVSAAKESVTIDYLDRQENLEDYYNKSTHQTSVYIQAKTSTGKTKGATLYVSGAKAYAAGKADGGDDVRISQLGRNPDYTDNYNSSTHNTTIGIKAVGSNGATKTATLTVLGSSAYNAGKTDGRKGWTEGTFTSVTVYKRGTAVYRYTNGGSVSGTNQGNQCTTALYNSSGRRLNITVYYSGSSYTHYLRGDGGYYYNDGGSATYYTKS